jgi:hypothetical protein
MSNDLLKLVAIATVALVAYTVLVKDGGLIKNQGTLVTEPWEDQVQADEPVAPVEAEAPKAPLVEEAPGVQGINAAADKKVVNNQIDDIHKNNTNVLDHPQISNNFAPQGNFKPSSSAPMFAQLDCFPKDQLVASDLLPKEGGFAESNPQGQGQLMNRNLFESGQHAGLNTQSSTLKNANRQLRSDPVIARRDIGPWNQSTYEADTNRRHLEIGSA